MPCAGHYGASPSRELRGLLWISSGHYPVPNFKASCARSRRDAQNWEARCWLASRGATSSDTQYPFGWSHIGFASTVARKTSPETTVVGPQTYRRADVYLSGQIHVFNILFQPAGLNRLVGINMTSLVNQDPAARMFSANLPTLDDAVRAAPDFRVRVAAVESWAG